MKTARCAMHFFQVLPFTDIKKCDGFWCVKFFFKVLTHQKPLRRFCLLFFEVLPFATHASSVNGKLCLQRKACQNDAAVFGVARP